jgi:serine/threonine protein kinase
MAELARGTIVAHIYEVESPLGSGGFGATYLARNTTLRGGQVVVKQVASEDQGEEEAMVLVGLQSANVVRVLAFDEKHRAIVMERAAGEPLADLIPKLSMVDAVRIAREVAVALSELETRELVHRDVKPENVMVTLRGVDGRLSVKVIDFGIALKAGKPLKGDPVGSPLYCPAEQHDRQVAPHPADDVYALGGVLFHMVTGRAPYTPEHLSDEQRTDFLLSLGFDPALTDSSVLEALQLRMMHERAPLPSIFSYLDEAQQRAVDPELLQTLDELLKRMLGKHRAGRPRAREVEHVLERMDGRFTSGATQVNFKLRSAPLPPTSTLVLPRRLAPKATTATPSSAAHVSTDQLAQQVRPRPRWALLAGVFAFLLGGAAVIALWPSSGSRGDPRPVTPTVAPPTLPVVAAVDASVEAPPLVVRTAVDAGDEELVPLARGPVKPVVKPTAPTVICDDRWRRAVIQELRDLHAEVARKDDDALFIRFEKDEERVLDKLNLENVSTSAGCVEADTAATRLLTRYRK